jgi:Holliday junction resolvase RusA-like endonuclease
MPTYQITPTPKPRMTQRDKWCERPSVMKYRSFSDLVKLHKIDVNDRTIVQFIIPMPSSWSRKKKEANNGELHKKRPDIDNLIKALLDSIYKDDSHISAIYAIKKWGYIGKITTTERNIDHFSIKSNS